METTTFNVPWLFACAVLVGAVMACFSTLRESWRKQREAQQYERGAAWAWSQLLTRDCGLFVIAQRCDGRATPFDRGAMSVVDLHSEGA